MARRIERFIRIADEAIIDGYADQNGFSRPSVTVYCDPAELGCESESHGGDEDAGCECRVQLSIQLESGLHVCLHMTADEAHRLSAAIDEAAEIVEDDE